MTTARPYGLSWCLPFALLSLGEVELRTRPAEELAEAERWLNQAASAAEQFGNGQVVDMATLLLAELDLQRGNPGAALERLREAAGGYAVAAVRAAALLASGRPREAFALASESLRAAESEGDRPGGLEARRVMALALAATGDLAASRRQLAEGLRMARRMGHRLAEQRMEAAQRGTG